MDTVGTPADSGRWAELIAALAAHVEDMAADFAQKVQQIPDYSAGLVATSDVAETAHLTFATLVEALQDRNPDVDARMLEYAADLGAKRARAGIPPSSLTAAVRLDFGIIWGQLLALAEADDGVLLASRAESVWRVVDEYAAQTHASYLAERVRMAQEESSVQREFVAALFGPEALSAETLARAGAALGLAPGVELALVAGNGKTGARIRDLPAPPGRLPVHVYEAGSLVYAFWARAATGSRLPAALAGLPCGLVASVDGLAGLRGAAAVAAQLAGVATDDDAGPLELESGWPRLARRFLEDAGAPLAPALDRLLGDVRDAERERLEETARSFLATGNATQTANELFCHRNTVLNRLARFQELTGVDLTVPAQAARVLVAWA